MKKLAIVGASALLAALPVVGVFAEDDITATDTIQITVDSTCSFGTTGEGKTVQDNMSAGTTKEDFEGSNFSISCNKDGGWYLQAKSEDGQLKGSSAGSSKPITTNANLAGTDSAWAFKAEATGGTVQLNYGNFSAVPTEDNTKIVTNNEASAATVKITYGVHIAGDQPADTYQGTVTYTLGSPAE